MADLELNENPESTWGATEDYKAAWHAKYGNVSPSASASKADWKAFATKNGMTEDEAEAATRDELVARYGAGQVVQSPSVPNAPAEATGVKNDGTGASPSAGDPAVRTATTGRGTATT